MSCYNRLDVVSVKYMNRRRIVIFIQHDPQAAGSVHLLYPGTMHIARVPLEWVRPLDQRRYRLKKVGHRLSVVRR